MVARTGPSSRQGYPVLVRGEPGELTGLISSEKPPLVLLDLVLPGIDGIEWMAIVPELSDLPVIFMSGYLQLLHDIRVH